MPVMKFLEVALPNINNLELMLVLVGAPNNKIKIQRGVVHVVTEQGFHILT